MLVSWVCINLNTNKVLVDSIFEISSTLLLVINWCTCQRVNSTLQGKWGSPICMWRRGKLTRMNSIATLRRPASIPFTKNCKSSLFFIDSSFFWLLLLSSSRVLAWVRWRKGRRQWRRLFGERRSWSLLWLWEFLASFIVDVVLQFSLI